MEQTFSSQNDRKTILVVDDDSTVLACISELLGASNYSVLLASNGEEALDRSRDYKEEIHLLLSDFQMPGISGVDLACAMSTERPRIKVLLMSGYSGGICDLNEGWRFLVKPFVPAELRSLVAGLIQDNVTRFSD